MRLSGRVEQLPARTRAEHLLAQLLTHTTKEGDLAAGQIAEEGEHFIDGRPEPELAVGLVHIGAHLRKHEIGRNPCGDAQTARRRLDALTNLAAHWLGESMHRRRLGDVVHSMGAAAIVAEGGSVLVIPCGGRLVIRPIRWHALLLIIIFFFMIIACARPRHCRARGAARRLHRCAAHKIGEGMAAKPQPAVQIGSQAILMRETNAGVSARRGKAKLGKARQGEARRG